MAEKKDKVMKLEAEIGRLFMKDNQLAAAKSENLRLLQAKLNELELLKQE